MRPLAIMALALAFAATAQAHIIGKPHGHTLKATIAFQEAQYAHSRYVCVKGSGEPKRWHCAASKFIRRELDKSRARLAPPKPAVDSCLSSLIQRESRWNVHATNPTTGAYGLPQALPGSKMASAGADWRDNPDTQIRWMLGYVNGRYGGSCAALAFQIAHGYY